jgi:hypothetical protein
VSSVYGVVSRLSINISLDIYKLWVEWRVGSPGDAAVAVGPKLPQDSNPQEKIPQIRLIPHHHRILPRTSILVQPSPSLKPHHEMWPHIRQVVTAIYNIFAFINERVCQRSSTLARLICRVDGHDVQITRLTEQLGSGSSPAATCGDQRGARCPNEAKLENLRTTVDRISQVLHRTENELQRLQGVLNGAACVLAFERPLAAIEAHSGQIGSTLRLE